MTDAEEDWSQRQWRILDEDLDLAKARADVEGAIASAIKGVEAWEILHYVLVEFEWDLSEVLLAAYFQVRYAPSDSPDPSDGADARPAIDRSSHDGIMAGDEQGLIAQVLRLRDQDPDLAVVRDNLAREIERVTGDEAARDTLIRYVITELEPQISRSHITAFIRAEDPARPSDRNGPGEPPAAGSREEPVSASKMAATLVPAMDLGIGLIADAVDSIRRDWVRVGVAIEERPEDAKAHLASIIDRAGTLLPGLLAENIRVAEFLLEKLERDSGDPSRPS